MAKYNDNWPEIAAQVKVEAGGCCEACSHVHDPANGYTLTVHHLDGNSMNDARWNLAALCQRCHLRMAQYLDLDQLLLDFMYPDFWLIPHLEGHWAEERVVSRYFA